MASNKASVVEHLTHEQQERFAQVDRIASSAVLHGSDSLCKLLRYLARQVFEHPGSSVKEYQIATEVFGRAPDFDPQMDSTVRVQVGRLRQKLAEYYASEGMEDPIAVDLPKGNYLLSFHPREKEQKKEAPQTRLADPTARRWHNPLFPALLIVSVLLAIAVAVIATQIAHSKVLSPKAVETQAAPPALQVFWKDFVSQQDEPWVIFSNAQFVGRPETGMRYLDPARDSKTATLDHYTGVGEVLAVHELDRVFASLGRRLRVKRGSLLSLDDVKNNDLIFLGSPAENLTLREIPGIREFVFERPENGPRKGDLGIRNVHPQPGEPTEVFATRNGMPETEDYAVIALLRGVNAGQSVLILAGTTTMGTQAAAEYVAHQSSVEELLLRLAVSSSGEVQPFEALLQVKVTRGVPMQTNLIALRHHLS
jgi:hypothetical protein